jgi:hypothetical protein
MGFKTTIGSQGVVTEKIAGNDKVVVEARAIKDVKYHGTNDGALDSPVNVFEAGEGPGSTGSLPVVSAGNVGLEVVVINADVSGDDIQVSASQPIDSDTWTYTVPEESATFLAVSSSIDGYSWIVTHVKS